MWTDWWRWHAWQGLVRAGASQGQLRYGTYCRNNLSKQKRRAQLSDGVAGESLNDLVNMQKAVAAASAVVKILNCNALDAAAGVAKSERVAVVCSMRKRRRKSTSSALCDASCYAAASVM